MRDDNDTPEETGAAKQETGDGGHPPEPARRYEMNPCRLVADGFERCEETSPDIIVWSVYRRDDDDLAEWLSDHITEDSAREELARLRSLPGGLV
jgi:hypothetical protein